MGTWTANVARAGGGGELPVALDAVDEAALLPDPAERVARLRALVLSAVTSAEARARAAFEADRRRAAALASEVEASVLLANEASATSDLAGMNARMLGAMVGQVHHGIEAVERCAREAEAAADAALRAGEESGARLDGLSGLSAQIASIVKLITRISAQTNMLALNAQIEAARAGAHGRGFAVVAQEVKALARETSDAADRIGKRVEELVRGAGDAARAVTTMRGGLRGIHEVVARLGGTVEDQRGVSATLRASIEETTTSVDEVGRTVGRVVASLDGAIGRARDADQG